MSVGENIFVQIMKWPEPKILVSMNYLFSGNKTRTVIHRVKYSNTNLWRMQGRSITWEHIFILYFIVYCLSSNKLCIYLGK